MAIFVFEWVDGQWSSYTDKHMHKLIEEEEDAFNKLIEFLEGKKKMFKSTNNKTSKSKTPARDIILNNASPRAASCYPQR